MASTKELTGGTNDVNPQQLTVTVSQESVDVDGTIEVPLPIPRTPTTKAGRTTVVEVLQVTMGWNQIQNAQSQRLFATVSTSPNAVDVTDGEVFAWSKWEFDLIGTAVTGAAMVLHGSPFTYNLSDGAGHGFLVGTDSLSFSVQSVNTISINTVFFKVLYRYKEVSLAEYIGIVQSQQ